MVAVKIIDAAAWSLLPTVNVAETDDVYDTQGPGTYRFIRSDVASVDIPTLIAGAIDQAEPTKGSTITMSGTNARDGAPHIWRQSPNGVDTWSVISGETTSSLDTSVVTDNYYVQGGILEDGAQGPVYTAAVLVSIVDTAPVTIDTASYNAPGAGNPPSIDHTLTYEGSRTLTAYGAFVDSSGGAPSKAQLKAGTGAGILEGQSVVLTLPSTGLDLEGFTITSETADEFHYYIEESGASPQSSLIEVLAVSALDFSAATVQTAVTDSTDGSVWTLTFDEAVYGTGVNGNWSVTSTGDSPTIANVTVNDTTTVVVTLSGDLPENGDTLTVSYSGGDLRDVDGNDIADIVSQSVTNNVPAVGFTENPVVLNGSQFYLGSTLPTGQRQLLAFLSIESAADSRHSALSWNGTDGRVYPDYVALDGTSGLATDIDDQGGGALLNSSSPFTAGIRYHGIYQVWNDGADLRSEIYLRSSGAWLAKVAANTASVGPNLVLDGNPLTLFARGGSTGQHRFSGTVYRLALWTGTSGAKPVDFDATPALLDDFAAGVSITDPATSQSLLSGMTRHIDLYGDAASWNANTNDGTMTITKTGTFS